jgi:hypothetical protein
MDRRPRPPHLVPAVASRLDAQLEALDAAARRQDVGAAARATRPLRATLAAG